MAFGAHYWASVGPSGPGPSSPLFRTRLSSDYRAVGPEPIDTHTSWAFPYTLPLLAPPSYPQPGWNFYLTFDLNLDLE